MSKSPWTKIYQDEFLQGCSAANLKADEIGVYITILLLISSRGSPIEDDRKWIAAQAGCSTRRCGQIIDRLGSLPNKLVIRNGMIGNLKMMRILKDRDKKSDQARKAVLARWRGDEAELPLVAKPKPSPPKIIKSNSNANKNGDKTVLKQRKKGQLSQKSAKSSIRTNDSLARARLSETQRSNTTQPNPLIDAARVSDDEDGSGSDEDKINRLKDADLQDLYQAVAKASGHNPASPVQIDRALRFVEKWKKAGIDFDQVVIPTIRAMISESAEPTRTLGRFDARICHEVARVAATPKNRPYHPPASPIVAPEGESGMFKPMREKLLLAIGPAAYSLFLNHVRFEEVDGVSGKNRRVMRVLDSKKGPRGLMDGDRVRLVTREAKAIGFTEVW